MAWEIERRFLVRGRPWEGHPGDDIVQAYLASQDGRTVRVRLRGGVGTLTVKGPTRGRTRAEFEIDVPAEQVVAMVEALQPPGRILKTRYLVPFEGHTWEVDVYRGDNEGLVVAEIELDAEDEAFALPPWAGDEVSDDRRYTNAWLAEHPWPTWRDA